MPISNIDNHILLKAHEFLSKLISQVYVHEFLYELINQVKVLVYCLEMTKVKLVLRGLGSRMTLSCGL